MIHASRHLEIRGYEFVIGLPTLEALYQVWNVKAWLQVEARIGKLCTLVTSYSRTLAFFVLAARARQCGYCQDDWVFWSFYIRFMHSLGVCGLAFF